MKAKYHIQRELSATKVKIKVKMGNALKLCVIILLSGQRTARMPSSEHTKHLVGHQKKKRGIYKRTTICDTCKNIRRSHTNVGRNDLHHRPSIQVACVIIFLFRITLVCTSEAKRRRFNSHASVRGLIHLASQQHEGRKERKKDVGREIF